MNMNQHLVSARQFKTRDKLEQFFQMARVMHAPGMLKNCTIACLFMEPSLRTRFSFERAVHNLGGTLSTSTNPQELSIAKGESFEDTIRTVAEIDSAIVLRSPEPGMALRAAKVSKVPVLNAGDGYNEHPTQALLDVYTIRQYGLMASEGATICLVGDLKWGRTIHSLCQLFTLYKDMHLILVSPPELSLDKEHVEELENAGLKISICKNLQDALKYFDVDVVYMTRLQKERFDVPDNFEKVWQRYSIGEKELELLHNNAIVMHPLPRNQEIDPAIDSSLKCVYFRSQIKNGVKIRMALLYNLFGGYKSYYEPYHKV